MKPIIRVENLSKQYRIGEGRNSQTTFREMIVNVVKSPFKKREKTAENSFWALKDVSFEIEPGEVVGIIGRNGAGKSTLLKILSRITEPTGGKAEIYGRVGSLLEVGTGFHQELTGRENIFLNGAILGMRQREIAAKFDEIVEFSEIEKFIDTPVKYYSSGMYTRLAFAVAANLDPEILVIDEVLAVGDSEFQKKCLGKMDEVSKQGRTVIFVSHQMGMLAQLCESCILLEKGSIIMQGETGAVINTYLNRQKAGETNYFYDEKKVAGKAAYVISQRMIDENGAQTSEITNENPIILVTKFRVEKFQEAAELSLSLQSRTKGRIFTVDTKLNQIMRNGEKEKTVRLEIPANLIAAGHYSWLSSIHVPGMELVDILWDECDFSIKDVGSQYARYEGMDYGCLNLQDYKIEVGDS